MRQITKREKAVLSIGALSAVAVFVWFVLLPMLQSGGPKEKSSLEVMQERLEAVQKLSGMSSILVDLEESRILATHADDRFYVRSYEQGTLHLADGFKFMAPTKRLTDFLAVISGKGNGLNLSIAAFP